ncbi:MAG TPA: ScyD/ScyE family protein, partial [Ignavibacteriaceae bacterium]
MRSKIFGTIVLSALVIITFYSCSEKNDNLTGTQNVEKRPAATQTVTVFAAGLNNPRGLKFGPDGYLYVAEGGLGGTDSTNGICDQVIPPIGPYKGGFTASISKISPSGDISIVADNLPSSQTSPESNSLVSGVADVAFIGNTLYALIGGAGCSHGLANDPNAIIKVNSDGTWNIIADLSDWSLNHPVRNPEEDDYEPDGTWYSMINVRGDLYAVEPNHGEIVRVSPSGNINRIIDVSASQGHIVPTAIAYHGNFYFGNLNTFPVVPGSSKIYKVNPGGQIQARESGLTAVLGLVFDNRDRMYVLEMTTADGDPTPFTGKIVLIQPSGQQQVIADSLFFPTGMTMGPDGALYVSNKGFGPP